MKIKKAIEVIINTIKITKKYDEAIQYQDKILIIAKKDSVMFSEDSIVIKLYKRQ